MGPLVRELPRGPGSPYRKIKYLELDQAGFQAGASLQWPSRVWFFRPNTHVGEGRVGSGQLLLECDTPLLASKSRGFTSNILTRLGTEQTYWPEVIVLERKRIRSG